MGILIQNGIDWILAIQALGGWLELPMKFFTFLGHENFFFLVLPLIYWSLDSKLGLQVSSSGMGWERSSRAGKQYYH